MKILGWFALVAVLAALPCAAFSQASASQPDYAAIGRETVSAMAQGQWAKVEATFDQKMKAALPAPKLAGIWKRITTQPGTFDRILGVKLTELKGDHIATVTCAFAHTNLNVNVVIDTTGRIGGLFFAPAPAQTSAWKAPAYANASAFQARSVVVGAGTQWPLPGTLTVPRGKGPFPAIVLVQGSGPEDEDETIGPNKPFKDLAEGLASRGIVVLRYEKRTRAFPGHIAANGLITVHDTTMNDAERAVSLLTTLPKVDKKQIYLLGHSLGGMLAPRIAAEDPKISGIVLMAANVTPLGKGAVEQLQYIAALPGNRNHDAMQKLIAASEKAESQIESPTLKPTDRINLMGAEIPGSFFLDLRSYHPTATAARLKIPILVLQGGHDYQVTATDYAMWKKALASDHEATFHFYPHLTHLFIDVHKSGPPSPADYAITGHVAPEVITDIADWVRTNDSKGL